VLWLTAATIGDVTVTVSANAMDSFGNVMLGRPFNSPLLPPTDPFLPLKPPNMSMEKCSREDEKWRSGEALAVGGASRAVSVRAAPSAAAQVNNP
jgi:hypothetical protein